MSPIAIAIFSHHQKVNCKVEMTKRDMAPQVELENITSEKTRLKNISGQCVHKTPNTGFFKFSLLAILPYTLLKRSAPLNGQFFLEKTLTLRVGSTELTQPEKNIATSLFYFFLPLFLEILKVDSPKEGGVSNHHSHFLVIAKK